MRNLADPRVVTALPGRLEKALRAHGVSLSAGALRDMLAKAIFGARNFNEVIASLNDRRSVNPAKPSFGPAYIWFIQRDGFDPDIRVCSGYQDVVADLNDYLSHIGDPDIYRPEPSRDFSEWVTVFRMQLNEHLVVKPISPVRHPSERHVLDVSTGHLSLATRDWLDSSDYPTASGAYGWLVSTADVPGRNAPADLRAVEHYARQFKCDWVLFDADAEQIDDLPYYGDDLPATSGEDQHHHGWAEMVIAVRSQPIVAADALEPEDRDVPAEVLYPVAQSRIDQRLAVTSSEPDAPTSRQEVAREIALDCFHETIPIGNLEDFDIQAVIAVDANGRLWPDEA